MGHSRAEKAKTHKRIVAIASKKFREEGLAGIGIAELMKEAGLTVGGFYKHFDSRDDLGGRSRRLCHASGGELEQIQFLLGHVSMQTRTLPWVQTEDSISRQ